jgi:hypothetical protein
MVAAGAPLFADMLSLTQISTTFSSPIGIDYHEPTNSVIISANYPSGNPHTFERINFDGTHSQFSNVSGISNEIKIATVRSGNVGGFTTGDLFSGNGVDGEILKISNNGATVINPWVSLTGAGNGLMRGSLHVDRTGAWGGDLIAVTTAGEVWRVNSAGTPTQVADVNTHLEGVMTVPNDPLTYGPLAGKIIAGAEDQNRLYAFDTDGEVQFINMGFGVEDIDMIAAGENFFGVNYGSSRILGAPAAEFAPYAGEILLTREFPVGGTGLYRLFWDGSALVTDQFTVEPGSAVPAQWEHVTFAPAGIVEIPQVPEPSTYALLSTVLIAVGYAYRRKFGHR